VHVLAVKSTETTGTTKSASAASETAGFPGARRAVDEWRETGLSDIKSFRPVDSLAVIRLMV